MATARTLRRWPCSGAPSDSPETRSHSLTVRSFAAGRHDGAAVHLTQSKRVDITVVTFQRRV